MVGAVGFPERATGALVDGEEEGALVLVTEHVELAVGEDGGGAHAVEVGEGAEGVAPAFVAIGGVGEQAVAGEEDVDVLAIGDGAGGGGVVEGVALLVEIGGGFAAPEEGAGAAVEREGEQLAVFVAGEEDTGGGDDGGGLAARDGGFPDDVFAGRDFAGQGLGVVDAGALGAAEAQPVSREERGEEQQEQRGFHALDDTSIFWGGFRGCRPGGRGG